MYDASYYDGFRNGSGSSARVVVPWLLQWAAPRSVIDLGCGTGDWLSVFKEFGVGDVLGIDGAHVKRDQLAISEAEFRAHDLTTSFSAGRRYDLALSLEVAEHLPPEAGASLIDSLTALAPLVLFSAAIPNQPGEHHVNCQWPAYWAGLFAEHGYIATDVLRLRLWNDSRVDWWYRQNITIYASETQLDMWPALKAMQGSGPPLALVHPAMFQETYRNLLEWGVEWERRYWDLRQKCGCDTSDELSDC